MVNRIRIKIYKLLRRSEKWTGTDMVYLARGGFWLTGNKIVGMVTSFALAITYANLLPKETYATYKYILSIMGLFAAAALPGMPTALTRAVALGYEGSLWRGIKTILRWELLGLLAGLIVSGYYFYNGNNILGIGFLIAAVFIYFNSGILYGPYLAGKKLFKTSAIYSSTVQIVTAISIVGVLFVSKKILIFLFVFYGSTVFIRLILFIRTLKKYKLNKKEDPETISFGKHLSVMSILGTISAQLDKILMWHFFGPIQLAIYSFAILPVNQMKNMVRSVASLALPKLSVQKEETLKKTLPVKIIKFSAILLVPAALYVLLCLPLFKIIFPEYINSVNFTKLYALSLALYPLRLFGTSITAHAKKKYLYIIRTINPLIKIGLLAALIPFWGIGGAIVASLISTAANGLISYSLFKKI